MFKCSWTMPKSYAIPYNIMISFTQNLISLDENQASICWIVENHTDYVIKKAVAHSNIYSHNFGEIGVESIKSISFTIPLSKASLLGNAFMNYFHDDEACMVKSNILRNF